MSDVILVFFGEFLVGDPSFESLAPEDDGFFDRQPNNLKANELGPKSLVNVPPSGITRIAIGRSVSNDGLGAGNLADGAYIEASA